MASVSGTVTIDGTAIEGAVLIGINDTQDIVEDTTTTDVNGDYTLQLTRGDVAHIKMQYEDPVTGDKYNSESKPFIVVHSGSSTLDINYDGPGIHATSLASPTWEPQGVTYSPDTGQWYVAEVTDSTTPSTVHEFNADGTETGDTFQFASDTPNPNHANALQWHDGHLWCSEFNSDTIYKIDWAAKSVVGSFAIGNGVVDGDKIGAVAFIPTTDGASKLLACMWGSTSSNVYLLNHDQAITDGTASGNVYLTLSDNIDTGRVQGAHYQGGYLYINSDTLLNTAGLNEGSGAFNSWGSYPTIKLEFPPADTLSAGDPLVEGRYVWWFPQPAIPFNDPIQDIGLDASSGTFWLASEGTNTIYAGTEELSVTVLPDDWSAWNLSTFAGPHNEWEESIHVDYTVAFGKKNQGVFFQNTPAEVEVWFYDDLATEKRVYVSTAESGNEYNTTEHAIAVNTNTSTTEYVSWNSTDGWHTTGVSRPATGQWVKFRWEMDGSETRTFVSTDEGATFQPGGTYTHGALALGELQIQTSSSGGGEAYIGPFEITPL